ncbi:hypothetical protein ACFQFC_22605 [Amorphoplanes digitatis]|uniref:hypothetical protein n=1 Tax=Actinoplanes digitatis TaxID=1868 RepID=UPI001941DEEA|nr:hypothetical protein [Actinoplanes digitatis]
MSVNGDLALQAELPVLIRTAAELARHCDRAEHNEQVDRAKLLGAAADLRAMGWRLSAGFGADLRQRYADRLEMLESRHPLAGGGAFDGGEAVRVSKTLLELQRAQIRHDMVYHPDVAGMPKYAQLRHFTLHLTKLTALLLDAIDGHDRDDFVNHRIADIFIFGIKISTVAGERLSEEVIGA